MMAPNRRYELSTEFRTPSRDGKRYDCGKEVTSALRVKIGKASITCKGDTRDQYDRLIAVCYLDDLDLNGWLVRQGHALAYRRYSKRYVAAEDETRCQGRSKTRPLRRRESRPVQGWWKL